MKSSPIFVFFVVLTMVCVLPDASAADSATLTLTPGEVELMAGYASPMTIPASEFRNSGTNPDMMLHNVSDGSLQGQGEVVWAVAPVYLPDGATISSVHAAVFDGWDGGFDPCDDVVGYDVGVWLMRVDNFSGEAQQMAFFASSGQDAEDQWLYEGSVDYPEVDYPSYSYYMVTRLCHSAHLFRNGLILYSMP